MKRRVLWAILLAGAAVRIPQYLSHPSLSYDEAMLAFSVVSRPFSGLLHPLDYFQSAPLLYLWITRLTVLIGGVNDFMLRLPSLGAGLVLPWVMWRVARRLLPEGAAAFAAAVAALAPGLAQYSLIVKPYELDALMTLLVADAALEARRGRLFLTGVIALFASAPAAFVVAGAGLARLWEERRRPAGALALSAGWGLAFAAAYGLVYRRAATGPYMQTYWAADFLTPSTYAPGGRAWPVLAHSFIEALALRPVPGVVALAATAILLMGLWWMRRVRGAGTVLLAAGPLVLTVAASLVRRYPFTWRLLQFAVPLVVLLLGAAVAWAMERGRIWRRGAIGGSALALLALTAVNVSHPYRTAPVRSLLSRWSAERRAGEPLYVFSGALPAWGIYGTNWRRPDPASLDSLSSWSFRPPVGQALGAGDSLVLIGSPSGTGWRIGVGVTQARTDSGWAAREVGRVTGAPGPTRSAWFIFTQTYGSEVADLRTALARAGARELEAEGARGAMLIHVTFGGAGGR